MENKISKKRIIFPAIHQEILSQLKEENKCNAYVKGYTTDGDKSKAGIKCHQPVLAMASPLLKAALETATDGSKQMCCCEQKASEKGDCFVFDGCIVLADASEDVIQSIIKFIYGKEVPQSRKLKDETMKWLDVLKVNLQLKYSFAQNYSLQRNKFRTIIISTFYRSRTTHMT